MLFCLIQMFMKLRNTLRPICNYLHLAEYWEADSWSARQKFPHLLWSQCSQDLII